MRIIKQLWALHENVFYLLLGHMATLSCSKRKNKFPGSIGKKVFAGFNRENWEKRTDEDHRTCVERINACRTKTEREKMESELGVRYSTLLELLYYDAIRMPVIDPMHNLFLGESFAHLLIE